MTDFERNARYSYNEKLSYLKEIGYDRIHLQTFSYKGFDVITTSKVTKGIRIYFYKDDRLVKMRNKNWKTDIIQYAKNYIDLTLIKNYLLKK